jgi:hypothetical protein
MRIPLHLLASTSLAAVVFATGACSTNTSKDADRAAAGESGPPPGAPGNAAGPATSTDPPRTSDRGAASFPAYVEALIEARTDATSMPVPDGAWGALGDDERHAVRPGIFEE